MAPKLVPAGLDDFCHRLGCRRGDKGEIALEQFVDAQEAQCVDQGSNGCLIDGKLRGQLVMAVAVDNGRAGPWGFLPRGAGHLHLPGLRIELDVAALEVVQRKEQCGAQGVPLDFELATFVGCPFELEFRVERREHMG